MDLEKVAKDYRKDGFVSGLDILSEAEALHHRTVLKRAEADHGSLHYRAKVHTMMRSPHSLATHPRILDIVEALIGPDILLYDVEYIIKEPRTPSFVSWHQDLTYLGLSDDAQVSLSPATADSGCMRMIPGSHKAGMVAHTATEDSSNVFLQGQTVEHVDEDKTVMCALMPGQASFHHGWALHASMPNNSVDRRVGLNAQYVAPHVRQTKHDLDSAMLVRGVDSFNHFKTDLPAERDFAPEAMTRWAELEKVHVDTQGTS